MKQNILILILLTMATMLNAQNIEIQYEMYPNVEHNMKKAETTVDGNEMGKGIMAQIKSAMTGIKMTYGLFYTDGESLYRNLKTEKREVTIMGQTFDLTDRLPDDITYKNHNRGIEVRQKEFMGKTFLIQGELEKKEWDIYENEVKQIVGFNCQKAISQKDSIEVWFTKDIPIQDGPIYTGLSGLVLEVISPEMHAIAKSVAEKKDSIKIEPPVKGKKISKTDFNKTVKKRMEMMGSMNSVFDMGF